MEKKKNTSTSAPKAEEPKAKAETQAKAEEPKAEQKEKTVLERTAQTAMKRYGLKEVHLTADGCAFRTESAARNHAATLKDKTIKTFKQ